MQFWLWVPHLFILHCMLMAFSSASLTHIYLQFFTKAFSKLGYTWCYFLWPQGLCRSAKLWNDLHSKELQWNWNHRKEEILLPRVMTFGQAVKTLPETLFRFQKHPGSHRRREIPPFYRTKEICRLGDDVHSSLVLQHLWFYSWLQGSNQHLMLELLS